MESENKENLEKVNNENTSQNSPKIEYVQKSKGEQINPGIGYGISALIFGIISIVFLYYIIISVLSAILAIVFGFQSIKKGDNGIGKAGLTLGIISVIITFLLFLFLQVLDVSLFTIPSWYK